ncbi:MAG TPA: biopolymer transporter ExbD [Xanthomonadales bacterium]|nr:biopolymer transporter ExbD [Xanthomonadales bacterium]
MAFSTNDSGDSGFTEPNVVPLVDVMLVMLIIFMVTTPLMAHKVKVELPEATLKEQAEKPIQPITLAVRANGEIYWNDQPINSQLLESQLAIEAQKQPQPQVDIRADSDTKYRIIQDVMRTARLSGIRKIAFVATPSD